MINLNHTFSGQYRCTVERSGEIVHDTGFFDNIITATGMNLIGSVNTAGSAVSPAAGFNAVAGRFVVGTGTTQTNAADTALDNLIATANADSDFVSQEFDYLGSGLYTMTVTHKFPAGAVVGNVAEVGLQSAGGLFSRSLILDAGGTPEPVTVGASDTFSCFYKLTVGVPRADISFQTMATVDGEPKATTVTCRVLDTDNLDAWYFKTASTAQVAAYTGGLGSPTANKPEGSLIGVGGTVTINQYNNDQKKSFDIAIAQGSLTSDSIATLAINCMMGVWQMNFNPPLKKTSAHDMELTIGYNWTR